jgi:hypothetical protein
MSDIVLLMLIKNENNTIYECLESVKNIITSYYITDIGSTDNTVNLIMKWGEENNIKGKIVKREFKNVGYNKTENFIEAKEWIKEGYVFFLNPEMKVNILNNFKLPQLKSICYKIKENNNDEPQIRLAKIKYNWKCFGIVYEYWKHDFEDEYTVLENIEIEYNINKKVNKELLLKGITEEPDNERYLYYLAKIENNIDLFKKRINLGGSLSEIYDSYLNIITLYLKQDNIIDASEWCFKSYHQFNTKFDSYIILCDYLKDKGYHNLCYFYADIAEKLSNNLKFSELKVITGITLNKIKQSYDLCELLLKKKEYTNKDLIIEYEILYLPQINIKNISKIDIRCNHLVFNSMNEYIYHSNGVIYSSDKVVILDLNEYKKNGYTLTSIQYIDNNTLLVNLLHDNYKLLNNYKLNKNLRINLETYSITEHEDVVLPLQKKDNTKSFVNIIRPFSVVNDKGSMVNLSLYNNLHKCGPKTNGIDYKNGFLMVLQVYEEHKKKVYYRLFWISSNFSQKKYSKAFYFLNKLEEEVQCIFKEKDSVVFIHKNILGIYSKLYIDDNEINKLLSE